MYETGQISLRLSADRKRFTFEGNFAPGDWQKDHAQLIYDALVLTFNHYRINAMDSAERLTIAKTYGKLVQEVEKLADNWLP